MSFATWFSELTNNSEKVRQFMEVFGQATDKNILEGGTEVDRILGMRLALIVEEVSELEFAVEQFRAATDSREKMKMLAEIFDALADILYVVYGFCHAFGIDSDLAFDAVHYSNMSKLGRDGLPVFRVDGKVLKGEDYRAPNWLPVIKTYLYKHYGDRYGLFVDPNDGDCDELECVHSV